MAGPPDPPAPPIPKEHPMGKLAKAFEKSDTPTARLRPAGASRKPEAVTPAITSLEELFEAEKWDPRLKISTDPNSGAFESFRRLRTPILYPSSGPKPRTILVTSVVPHEGKGFITANLGVAIARDVEHHALMLDCDFRSPALAQLFGLSNETGLVDHLRDKVDLPLLIRKTGQPKLSLIPSGRPPANPSEMLTSARMSRLIDEMAERYDDRVILFDSPPNIVASETGILAKHLDGVVLVVRHGGAKKEHVKRFVDAVGPEKIVGLVYNAYPETTLESYIEKKMGYGYGNYYK